MLQLWAAARGQPSGMGGHSGGTLPDAGGAGDQAAVMMDAIACMTSAWAELEPRRSDDPGQHRRRRRSEDED